MRSAKSPSPRVSVIVSTNGRCASLATLVECLRFQRFGNFELCLVCGPRDDGTRELAGTWHAAGEIKLAFCDEANLSLSRNAGLAIAAGDHVAFIDDDALPEPVWLAQLVAALASGDAVGTGGLVFEPDGRRLQFGYSSCNRFGLSTHGLGAPVDAGAFPLSPSFPHFMGTNCMFRRDAVTALGGFDEEYQYYLEETDLCCRLVDRGGSLRQLDRAPVYHKFLAGTVRDAAGIVTRNYPILKSQLYFSLRHARSHASLGHILEVARKFSEGQRAHLEAHAAAGRVHPSSLDQFDADAERALEVGLTQGLGGTTKVRPVSFFERPPPFLRFPTQAGVAGGRHIVFLLEPRSAAPDLHQRTTRLAERLAAAGHQVRLMAVAAGEGGGPEESVDFEEGVWKHWLKPAFPADPPSPAVARVRERFWGRAVAARAALERIGAFSPIDLIEDRSDSGLSLAVALASLACLQLHVDSDKALRSLQEAWPHGAVAAVAQRAACILSGHRDERAWRRVPVEVRDRVVPVQTSIEEQVEAYSRWSEESGQVKRPSTDGAGLAS
jgi:glycogen(starch) synthase